MSTSESQELARRHDIAINTAQSTNTFLTRMLIATMHTLKFGRYNTRRLTFLKVKPQSGVAALQGLMKGAEIE